MHTSRKHWVKKQNPAVRNVLRQLVVEQLRQRCLFVSLDEELPDPYGPATITETLLHGFSGTHDRNTTYLSLELKARICATDRRGHGMLNDWEMIEALLDKKPYNSVRIEYEVRALRGFVSDDPAGRRRYDLRLLPSCS